MDDTINVNVENVFQLFENVYKFYGKCLRHSLKTAVKSRHSRKPSYYNYLLIDRYPIFFIWGGGYPKINLYYFSFLEIQLCDGQTDGQTDKRTHRSSYRGGAHLKIQMNFFSSIG